jgi:hypothetical protein
VVEEPNTRIVVQRASSSPPPSASDEMAAIVGIGKVDRFVKVFRRPVRKAFVLGKVSRPSKESAHALTLLV